MASDCKVHTHPRAFEIMTKVFEGKMTYVEAAQTLELPVPTVWHCFANHWDIKTSGERTLIELKQAESVDDFVEVLRDRIKKMINLLDEALALPVNAYNASTITKYSQEVRAFMRDILEFEGKLKTGTVVQLSIVQMQMTKLTSWLLTNLSKEDVAKLQKVLPELMAVGAIEST